MEQAHRIKPKDTFADYAGGDMDDPPPADTYDPHGVLFEVTHGY